MSDEEYARSLSQLVDQLTVMLEAEHDYAAWETLHDMRETALRMADDVPLTCKLPQGSI